MANRPWALPVRSRCSEEGKTSFVSRLYVRAVQSGQVGWGASVLAQWGDQSHQSEPTPLRRLGSQLWGGARGVYLEKPPQMMLLPGRVPDEEMGFSARRGYRNP